MARFFAFAGMVIVNFRVVMLTPGAEAGDTGLAAWVGGALEGRAAATFVVLAGIGLGLAAARHPLTQVRITTIKRALFLFVIGLLNCVIFEADILHYYAVYFLIAVPLLSLASVQLGLIIIALTLAFPIMAIVFNYDTGWDWSNYHYTDFWSVGGFVRNLLFNGWHPVIPWLGFLLFGIVLSRLSLTQQSVQLKLMAIGGFLLVATETTERIFSPSLAAIDAELVFFLATEPVPPMPLYILAGIGASMLAIGFCLSIASAATKAGVLRLLAPAGKQTLSLYVVHIIIGMGTLEAMDLLGNQSAATALYAALLFSLGAVLYAWVWSRFFKRGPLEYLMRSTAG